ncbi:MAG: ABC transporter ATP-binding protein [Nitrososphaerota archaeon]
MSAQYRSHWGNGATWPGNTAKTAAPVDTPLLELRNITVHYGQIAAVRNLSISVGAGEVVALLGANGAGKTTTLRTISGLLRPRSGEVRFGGKRIDRKSTEQIARSGVAHLPEGRGIFPRLTVAENLRMAGYGVSVDTATYEQRLRRVLTLFPILRERMGQLAGTLSGGQQQMLAVSRALVTNPRLLMIDELSFGLAPGVVKQLFALLPTITSQGTAILLVEQFVGQALAIADHAYVLEKGVVTFDGSAEALAQRDGFVESSYLGSGAARPNYAPVQPKETEMLHVRVEPGMIRRLREVAGARRLSELANEALSAYVAAREQDIAKEQAPDDIADIPTSVNGHGSQRRGTDVDAGQNGGT